MAAHDRKDYATALKHFRALAEQGNAKAQNILGWMYNYGLGVTKDRAETVRWYRKAAEQGYAEAYTLANELRVGFTAYFP